VCRQCAIVFCGQTFLQLIWLKLSSSVSCHSPSSIVSESFPSSTSCLGSSATNTLSPAVKIYRGSVWVSFCICDICCQNLSQQRVSFVLHLWQFTIFWGSGVLFSVVCANQHSPSALAYSKPCVCAWPQYEQSFDYSLEATSRLYIRPLVFQQNSLLGKGSCAVLECKDDLEMTSHFQFFNCFFKWEEGLERSDWNVNGNHWNIYCCLKYACSYNMTSVSPLL